jgi:shikimate dehydrogenase
VSETKSSYHLAIVGWPVTGSLSPELWETMGEGRGLEIEYERWPVEPGDTEAWEAIWVSDLDAFNVTAPHKEAAVARCDRLSSPAERTASVNTVLRKSGGWRGETTDGYGFLRSLEDADVPLVGQRIALLGTGGAGRAIARAIADAGARVTFVSRAPERAVTGCEERGGGRSELRSGGHPVPRAGDKRGCAHDQRCRDARSSGRVGSGAGD